MEYLRKNGLLQFVLGLVNYYFIIAIIYIVTDLFMSNMQGALIDTIRGFEMFFPIPILVFGLPILFLVNTLFLSRNSSWFKKLLYLINTVVAFSILAIVLALYIIDVTK